MPFYDIQYSFPLTSLQRQTLTEKITELHTTTFNTPSLFVNVRLAPLKEDEYYFYGGERRINTNRIFAHVRGGPDRSNDAFDKLAEDIEKIWDEVVGRGEGEWSASDRKRLNAVFIVPGIIAREASFAIPSAGQEGPWFEKNWAVFQARAEAGDEDMKNLVAEIEKRPELLRKDTNA